MALPRHLTWDFFVIFCFICNLRLAVSKTDATSFVGNIPDSRQHESTQNISAKREQMTSVSMKPISSYLVSVPSFPPRLEWMDKLGKQPTRKPLNDIIETSDESVLSTSTNVPSTVQTEIGLGRPLPTAAEDLSLQIQSSYPTYTSSFLESELPTDSLFPSPSPSDLPSERPSTSPTSWSPSISVEPSAKPSMVPTLSPSRSPSDVPSASPSFEPTPYPSASPSVLPSRAPSLTCHDIADYRSPLNNFTCTDHANSDCTQWRFLGLDADDIEKLIISCPVSCQIECGSLIRFSTNISFQIFNVDNFLAPNSVDVLETVSIDYFTKFIKAKEPTGYFSLYQVLLLSQTIISKKLSRFRRLQSFQTDLSISMAVGGFVIDIVPEKIQGYILAGIASPGYVNALRSSGDSTYDLVEVNSTLINKVVEQVPTKNSNSNNGSAGIVSGVIVGFLCLVTAGGLYVYKRRKTNKNYINEKDDDSGVYSPQVSVRSPLLGVLSFDSVARLLSSGGSPRSDDSTGEAMTTDSQSTEPESLQGLEVDPLTTEEDQHPLTGIIPPMIVYELDACDLKSTQASENEKNNVMRNVVPSIHVKASPSLRRALCEEAKPALYELMYSSIMLESQSISREPYMGSSSVTSSDDGAATNVEKSMSTEDDNEEEIPGIRKSVSDSAISNSPSLHNRRALRLFYRKRKLSWLGTEFIEPFQKNPALESRNSGDTSNVMLRHAPPPITSKNRSVSDGIHGSENERITENTGTESNSSFMQTLMNFSTRRLRRQPSLSQEIIGIVASERDPLAEPGSPSVADVSPRLHERLPGVDGKLLIFSAPGQGKLGLVIQCIADVGPMVMQVKDYSPLLGHVVEGDRIVEIGGTSTVDMSIKDVLSTMSMKQSSRRSPSIRLVIWRPAKKDSDLERSEPPTLLIGGYEEEEEIGEIP